MASLHQPTENNNKTLTSLAQDPPMRKFPGMVGGLKARQLMLSSGGEVTSTSCQSNQDINLIKQ